MPTWLWSSDMILLNQVLIASAKSLVFIFAISMKQVAPLFTVIYGAGIVLTVRRYYDTFYIANIEWLGIDALIYPVFSWQVIYRGLRRMITKVLCGWAGKPVSRPLQFIRCY